jgi:hypothetical protein
MPGLALQRCFHHEEREAVSRCPSCGRFFCRECVLPHDGRLLCSACILALSEQTLDVERTRRAPRGVWQVFLAGLALLLVWVVFYFTGWTVIQMRSTAPIAALTAVHGGAETPVS